MNKLAHVLKTKMIMRHYTLVGEGAIDSPDITSLTTAVLDAILKINWDDVCDGIEESYGLLGFLDNQNQIVKDVIGSHLDSIYEELDIKFKE